MNSLQRFGLIVFCATLFVVIAGLLLADPKWAILVGLISNTIAAPFGQKLTNWVDQGARVSDSKHGLASTSFIVFFSNVYAFLAINIFGNSVVSSFDFLEKTGLLKFTSEGYREAQIYAIGAIAAPTFLSTIVVVSCLIGVSSLYVSFAAFALGTYAAIPAFLAIGWLSGLQIGYEHVTAGTVLIGAFTFLAFGACVSGGGWGIAKASRRLSRY